ncbi:MAG: DUF3037 domain-containing protein [Alteromonadaceae bacterium]|nr:DUF3037 domain-containing protein [Alteromonadaceae bacterium]
MQCMFAVVRFMPFAETREFANVGVVLIAPKLGLYNFKLAPKKFARVTNFFDDLDGQVYQHAVQGFEDELNRIRNYFFHHSVQGKGLVDQFKEITRPRESVVHFGEIATLITDNFDVTLETLYERFIGRNFSTAPEYREQQMVRLLKKKINTKLPIKYGEIKLKAGIYEIPFPLVNKTGNKYRAIKPLAFEQKTALKAIEHSEQWIHRVGKLINSGVIDAERTLFALEKPNIQKEEFIQVYEDVSKEIKSLGAIVENFSSTSEIIKFAAGDLSAESVEKGFH